MQLKIRNYISVLLLLASLVVGSCSTQPTASISATDSLTHETNSITATEVSNTQFDNLPRLEGKATVVLRVKGSPITIEIDGTKAPITAGNFVDLVQRGVYDGLVFHRVVREPQPFVVQGGDPQGKDPNFPVARMGTGGFVDPQTSQTRYIPLEITPQGKEDPIYSQTFSSPPPQLQHILGAVAMARSQNPDSASSQFYIALAELQFLDGNYAVFGYVTDGMDVVETIEQGDRIESAEVIEGIDNLKT